MPLSYFVLHSAQRQPALNVAQAKVIVLADEASTGSFGVTFQQGEVGTGPKPHSHNWDECFYVLEGEVTFVCEQQTHRCTPGTLAFIPAGTVHSFTYGEEGGRMLEITGQGSHAAAFFRAIDSEIPPGPRDLAQVVAVASRNGVTIHL